MSLSRLRQILVDQINDKYLALDNPAPADNRLTTRLRGMFKHGGLEGRNRAELYKKEQIISTVDDDNALARRVLEDINNSSSVLDTSADLRKRLLDGLVAFYVISDENINAEMDRLKQVDLASVRFAASPFAGGYAPVRDDKVLRFDAKKLLVSQAIAKKTSENAPSRAIGDNSL